jgi:hypothetical protein
MTTATVTARLARRWPTALALAAVAGCCVLVFRRSLDVEFAAGVATMMGVYPAAYAIGKPAAAWPAFGVLVLVALGFMALGVEVGLGMTAVLVLLWLCALARGLARDGRWFGIETAGVFAFGGITIAALAVDPRLGGVLAGVGWFAHGLWDAYHFAHDRVVNRPWSEMCAVVDIPVGLLLLVVSLVRW